MPNLFFRTNIAPYRIDTYNALHERMDCELYFYWDEEHSQKMDMIALKELCRFIPHVLKGFEVNTGEKRRKICTEVWKIIRESDPSFIIVPEFQIITLQVLLYRFFHRSTFKVVSMCDDSYDMIVNNNDFSIIHKCARKIVTPFLDDLLLVDSRVVQWYQQHYKKGIWLPIIRNEKTEQSKYISLLPLSNQLCVKYELIREKVVLFVGRFVALKNLDRLLLAFEKTKEKATLVLVGDGEEYNLLQEKSKLIHKRVIFTGHLEGDELYAWYNIADVFVLPSYQEAFGAVTNEALLAGCRVVVSEKAGSACLVNKENGELIDPMDVNKLAEAIDRQLQYISTSDILNPRNNKMTVAFEERINNLTNKLSE